MNEKQTIVTTVIESAAQAGLWRGVGKNQLHNLAKIGIVCFLSIYGLQLIALIEARHDSDRFFEGMSVIFFCGMGILKLYSLYRHRTRWLNILTKMNALEKQQVNNIESVENEYDSDEENSNSKADLDYTDKFLTTFNILRNIYRFTGVIYVFSPFLEYGLRYYLDDNHLVYPHILPSWNPLDEIHFSCYTLVILIEAVAAGYCVLVHIAFDVTAIGVMIFACGWFSYLFGQASLIGGKDNSCEILEEVNSRAHLRIIQCHRIHFLIKEVVNDLDKLLRDVLGVYFFLSTLTLCSVALRLNSEQMSVMQLVSLVQYMGATLMQLFLYCSYGDAVMNESSIGAGEGPFAAAIWRLNPKIRKEILMLGVGMIKPQSLHAGPFNTVNLPTFIQIVRAAYSYYAVVGQK